MLDARAISLALDWMCCRNVEGFVGLKNGSATCYMNAVFQQLFMTPRVRMAILAEPEEPEELSRRDSLFYQIQVCAGSPFAA